jgi:hypothetical protein
MGGSSMKHQAVLQGKTIKPAARAQALLFSHLADGESPFLEL